MFVIYRYDGNLDPRHKLWDSAFNLALVEVPDPGWIDWSKGNPKIVPDAAAEMYNAPGRPLYRRYQDTETGQLFPSKGSPGINPANLIKIERPYTDEEKANVLTYMKIFMTARVEDIFNIRFQTLSAHASPFEQATWPQQQAEAANGGGPLLQAMAAARGSNVSELVAKIKEKSAVFYAAAGELLGKQQRHIREINACQTVGEASILNEMMFGIPRWAAYGEPVYTDCQVHI
jgi:hypothetical protein